MWIPFGSSSVGSFKDSAMIQTAQHLEPKTTGQRKARDLQQPAGVFRYSTCVLESGHAVTDLFCIQWVLGCRI